MHAPTVCIFGLPAFTDLSKNPLGIGLNPIAVTVGGNTALFSRASPALLNRIRCRPTEP